MRKVSKDFEVVLDNVPLVNLRNEFNTHYALMTSASFRGVFAQPHHAPIETPYLTWHGYSDAALTILLQRALIGIEAYVTLAVYFRLGDAGLLNKVIIRRLRDPFSLGGSGTADNYYNRLPALVSDDLMLRMNYPEVWQRTRRLYKDVRNPLFHGYELKAESVEAVRGVWEHIAGLHAWVDGWFDMNTVLPGGRTPGPRGDDA